MKTVLAGALLLLASGCIEIDGQRLTWRYDRGRDVLTVLVLYDGIHESDAESGEGGADQIAEFAVSGDLMLVDWFGHVEMKAVAKAAGDEDSAPALRAFAGAVLHSLKSTIVGHYRDEAGRIGALQLVEVEGFRELVAKGNALLNESILDGEPDHDWRLTAARMLAGAREGKQWITLRGNSIGIEFPAHPREWAERKAKVLDAAMHGVQTEEERKCTILALTQGPVLLRESAEGVHLRLGDRKRPVTLRFRRPYEEGVAVDQAVKAVAAADLDSLLADRLLGKAEGPAAPGVAALLEWGTPEDRVRALVRRARSAEGEERAAALAALDSFGEEWNRTQALPEAPDPALEFEAKVAAWWAWYGSMLRFPD